PPERRRPAGFDFVSISDHYHPWIDAQGHSGFVWAVLGAMARATERIEIAVGVTCPTVRIHPAIIAQATATTARLLPGRFVWGVGSGEALNEQILGDPWPPADVRIEMLEEAVGVIRELWEGESVTHRGRYYTVVDARIYDPPPHRVPLMVSEFGPRAAEVAARIGDGLWVTGTDPEPIDLFIAAGGTGPVYSQLGLCWAADTDAAVATVRKVWPNAVLPGQLSQDLRTPAHFEQAVEIVTDDMIRDAMPCGPDPAPVLDSVAAAVNAGVDHVYLHQIGPDQEGFLRFWADEIAPEVAGYRDGD
ncbi:MAG: TIGR03557 family F420-dependent LLM class oxidoreductase, partial [Actinomycetota bacterium]|nr:TIGR03557 family F420-dependent LLM class oxidoreductase [Actinomycetota bacterium]